MSTSPTCDQLASILNTLASWLASLETVMQNFGITHPPPAVHVAHTHANIPVDFHTPPPKKSKGKGKAKAPPPMPHTEHCHQHPSSSGPKALAKGKQATKPAAMWAPPTFHQAQVFPKEGQPNRMLVTVVIPASSTAHVVGKGGKGLKQISDIAGAQVSAFEVATSLDKCHISLWGTDVQIDDVLSVLGKRIAKKHVHYPKKKATKEPSASSTSVPPPTALARKAVRGLYIGIVIHLYTPSPPSLVLVL